MSTDARYSVYRTRPKIWTPEEVFTHPIGQQALEGNVGAQLLDNLNAEKWVTIEQADIGWLMRERELSRETVREIGRSPFPRCEALVSLFQAIMDREHKFVAEWLRK